MSAALFRGLFDDPIFNACFFGTQKESKPPSENYPVYDEKNQFVGWKIVYALAGFRTEDLEIWAEDNALFVSGNNSKEGSPLWDGKFDSKFSCNFKHRYALTDKLDITKIETTHENGLLSIFIPIKEEAKPKRVMILGKKL
jgi:HSP20 family molecular chaperone IbpA